MTLEKILTSLGEEKANEFSAFYQFLQIDEKQAILDSELNPLILYSVLLATQGSCSTSALEHSEVIELINVIKDYELPLSKVQRAVERIGSEGLSIQELVDELKNKQ